MCSRTHPIRAIPTSNGSTSPSDSIGPTFGPLDPSHSFHPPPNRFQPPQNLPPKPTTSCAHPGVIVVSLPSFAPIRRVKSLARVIFYTNLGPHPPPHPTIYTPLRIPSFNSSGTVKPVNRTLARAVDSSNSWTLRRRTEALVSVIFIVQNPDPWLRSRRPDFDALGDRWVRPCSKASLNELASWLVFIV